MLASVIAASMLFAACSGASNTTGGVVPNQAPTNNAVYSPKYPNVQIAGPMPTPMTVRPIGSGSVRPQVDIPGNIELAPAAISSTSMTTMSHSVPSGTGTPWPSPSPTTKPCTNVCLCNASAPTNRTTAITCPLLVKTVAPDNTVGSGDHEFAGYALSAGSGSGVGDVYNAMSVDNGLGLPTPGSGVNELYAPTTRGPNGNCIELSTTYFNGYNTIGSTVQEVQIWDFCKGGWAGAVPIDSNFISKYVRVFTNGDGLPQYIAEVAQGTDSAWHAYLYNNNNGYWDDIYDSAAGAVASDTRGWSIFETYLSAGENCPTLSQTFGESGLRLHYSNVSHQNWSYPSSSSFGYYNGGSCFPQGGSTSPYYSQSLTPSSDMAWTVTSR